jgi:hypothetical protein
MSPHSFLPVGQTFTVDEDEQARPPSTNSGSKSDATTGSISVSPTVARRLIV